MNSRNDLTPTLDQRVVARQRPASAPVMFQTWSELLFLHWEWDAEEIQRTLPEGLTVDLHQDKAYLGVVPFSMCKVRPRFLPTVPGISNFLELNLRTYVHEARGVPGVWFYSLDANQRLAVTLARKLFSLPYHFATMQRHVVADASTHSFSSLRVGDASPGDRYRYTATQPLGCAKPGTLEFFLLERYVLFAQSPRGLRAGRVHHEPYPFGPVKLSDFSERLFALNGFKPPERPPDHAVRSPGVDVSIYPIQPLR